jgi:biotin synthase-like enzyme
MPPLITRDEALRLGEIEDHAEIEALVERAWQARQDRFGDATDMCSLVNAKSGGCAEDCGFCAQSRFAEAETPMHAMMEPEQILEHARAAEAAGAHRFCMVTQGQGLSKRDFEKVLEGTRLVARHTNLKRCASIGHMSPARARALKEAGVQRVHHNVETARSYYPEVTQTVRYEGRLRTIDAVREARLGAEAAVLRAAAGLRVDERAHVGRVVEALDAGPPGALDQRLDLRVVLEFAEAQRLLAGDQRCHCAAECQLRRTVLRVSPAAARA